jgi:predicted ester cyclase
MARRDGACAGDLIAARAIVSKPEERSHAMSAAENKMLIRRLNDEFWNRGNPAVLDEVFAPGFVDRTPVPGVAGTLEGFRQFALALWAAFAAPHAAVDHQIAEGDKVAWRWTFRGTQIGPLMGIPPTGKTVTMTGITIDRVGQGRIVERWSAIDNLGVLQQLGVIPGPTGEAGSATVSSPPPAVPSAAADIDANKAIDRRYAEEVLDRGKLGVIDEICAVDYVGHVPGMPPMDREGDKQLIGMLRTAFRDLRCTIDDQIAEGDRVVHRLTCSGTHDGDFMGVPPSGNHIIVGGININRIANCKIAESWGVIDMLGLLRQIGALPG